MSTKISQLTSATDITASDLMQIVDVEDGVMAPSGTNKKATAQLVANNLAKIVNDGAVITANTSTDAVRITQTGSGNAVVVEDSTNPDATPFVISSSGQLFIGRQGSDTGLRTIDIVSNGGANDANNGNIRSIRSANEIAGIIYSQGRTRGSAQTPTIVQVNDSLGSFVWTGYDGVDQAIAARISSNVDGTPGLNDMPGRLEFATTSDGSSDPTERMRITSAGNVGIGTDTPSGKLEVKGTGNDVVVLNGDSFVGLSLNSYRDSSSDHGMLIYKAARGTAASPSAVQSGDNTVTIVSRPYDGAINIGTAAIRFLADGAVSSGVIPQEIRFITGSTSLDVVDRIAIKSSGNIGIGTISPSSKLHVAGDLTMSSATVATSATAGTNGDVPAQVAGYLVVSINGTARKIPYYA
jgi:hypothetical protein